MMNNLAGMYWRQKRWKEAEELYLQELEARKKVFGREHRDTLTCMENLAWTYRKQGLREQAKKLFLQVLEMRSRVLGPENPATLGSKRDLEAELDGLPLALATAHAYLKETSTTFRDYWWLYKAPWLKLQQMTPELISYEDRALYSTWNVSFTYIEQQNVLASKLLQF